MSDIEPKKLYTNVHEALKLWHSAQAETSPLDYLYLFQQARHRGADNARQATNEVILAGLDALEENQGRDADLLRLRFLDRHVMRTVANQLNMAESTANKKQRQAIQLLTDIMYEQEQQARSDRQALLERRLELPPDVLLIGVESRLDELQQLVTSGQEPWIVSIEGLGGIGKTALANALVRRVALSSRFYDVAWVSAKQQEFLPSTGFHEIGRPALDADTLIDSLLEQFDRRDILVRSPQEKLAALTERLKKQSLLIVIDNLETLVDYQTLLPLLRKLAHPARFLLTSRHSLRAHSEVACFELPELSQDDTLAFLRQEAQVRRLDALSQATDRQLHSIFEVVGGNPLALKLVVGQIASLPLSQVLDNLREARGKKIEELYNFIYWQAWAALDNDGRQALLSMPLAQNGAIDQLIAVSELEPDDLAQALEQLVSFSLVDVGGDLEQRRYRIHRLTETFLLNEVIKWQASL
jgi:LuxR family glucitol operon transcriptional activator